MWGKCFEDSAKLVDWSPQNVIWHNLRWIIWDLLHQEIKADPRKVQAILGFPVPSPPPKSFFGLGGVLPKAYTRFHKNGSPLHQLTKMLSSFGAPAVKWPLKIWRKPCTDAKILAFPDFERAFILETDASITGLGAVLSQNQPSPNEVECEANCIC